MAGAFEGVGAVIVGVALTIGGQIFWRWWRVKASEADLEQTKDLALRDMVATMYAGLVTAEATPMNPDPPPGLIERVQTMTVKMEEVQVEQKNVADALSDHRVAVSEALTSDQHEVKALLEQHIATDERNFDEILDTLKTIRGAKEP